MRSVFTDECAVGRLDETVGQRRECGAERPIVDRQDDANITAGLVVPKHAEFDLVALPGRAGISTQSSWPIRATRSA